MRTIVVVTFTEASNAYQAFSLLKELHERAHIELRSAVVVERLADGQPVIHDYADPINLTGDPRELIDTLVDGLAGITDPAPIASSIPFGSTAVIAELDESVVDVVDNAMADLGGTVARASTRRVRTDLKVAKARRRQIERQERRSEREANRREGEREWAERHNERIDRAEALLAQHKVRVAPPDSSPSSATRR